MTTTLDAGNTLYSMKLGQNRSLQNRIKCYACLLALAIVSFIIWNALTLRTQAIKDAHIDAKNVAIALSQETRLTLEGVDNVLVNVTSLFNAHASNYSSEQMDNFLKNRVDETSALTSVFVLNADGKLVAQSEARDNSNISNAFYDVFYRHKQSEDLGLQIDGLIKTASGSQLFSISRRMDDPNGNFKGVAFAIIYLNSFLYFFDALKVGADGVILLASDSGILIVRRPFSAKEIGSDIHDSPLFMQIKASGLEGTSVLPSRLDGIERIHSYKAVGPYPLVAAVSLSFADILMQWKVQIIHMILIAAIILSVIGFGVLSLLKRISAGEKTHAQLIESEEDLRRANEQLGMLALHDALTGLANRRRFDIALRVEFARAMRSNQPVSLILIDVDHFKKYNDTYGHRNGDICLRAVSDALTLISKRPGDLIARYGGEEIAVLLPGTDDAGAAMVAEAMRSAIEKLAIPHKGSDKGVVTISAGIAMMIPKKNGSTSEHLIRAADRALYLAKEAGRDCVRTSNATVDVLM